MKFDLKKLLWVLFLLFIVYSIYTSPQQSANVFGNIVDIIVTAFRSLATFFSSILNGR